MAQAGEHSSLTVTDQGTSAKQILVSEDEKAMAGQEWSIVESWSSEVHVLFSNGHNVHYAKSTNNGITWSEEVLHTHGHRDSSSRKPMAVYNAVMGTDNRGSVHIFLAESEFRWSKGIVYHYYRSRASEKWTRRVLDENISGPVMGTDMDLDIDCGNRIHLVYNIGKSFTRYAFWNGKLWQFSDIAFGERPVGCAVSYGFGDTVHVAIGSESGSLGVASQKMGAKTWHFEKITEPVYYDCDLVVANDGSIMVASSPMDYQSDPHYQLSIKRKGGEQWKTYRFGESSPLSEGGTSTAPKSPVFKTDISGRLHLVYYLHPADSASGHPIAYMTSSDFGQSWTRQLMGDAISNFQAMAFPDMDWNNRFVFTSYKTAEGYPALLRTGQTIDLESIDPCKYKKPERVALLPPEEVEEVKEPEPETPYHETRSDPEVNKRKIDTQGDFATRDSFVKVILKDYQEVDGDTISLYYRGNCILFNHGLDSRPTVVTVDLVPGSESDLMIFARSEGTRPPCTVSLAIKDSKKTQQYTIRSNLESNGAIKLRSVR
ncbi:MAG TPA: hypothetical protein DDW81_09655 [Cryomorphaceae bacterium]|nr:hypothetical protein [Owenweeksia sp.]HBF20353.1 hypothetical protein [Cryomorphaceae bacterium]